MASLGVERMSLSLEALDALGVKVKHHDDVLAGAAIGTGVNLIWASSPSLQQFDTGILEHYHASLALFMTDNPVAHGIGAALLVPDIITTNPFGINSPEPERSTGLAIGLIEVGLLAVKYASRYGKRK